MTKVVCDSGPLTHLWQIDLWFAFAIFDEVHLADRVAWEVQEHVSLGQLGAEGYCAVYHHEVSRYEIKACQRALPLGITLEDADLATLALAQEISPDWVLTDDLNLRRAIETKGLVPMGSVGILLGAYEAGHLDAISLDRAIDALFVHSTLYLSPSFKVYIRKIIRSAIDRHNS